MGERALRDHSQPCNHIDYATRRVDLDNGWRCGWDECPGGREVTIDYEAAIELARTFRNLEWNHRAVRVVIDAALEET